MQVFHYDNFTFPLPAEHRFPVRKYYRLSQALQERSILSAADLRIPPAASEEQLALVHTRVYIAKVLGGGLDEKEVRRMGLPWSPELVERARRSVGSTIAACRAALEDGLAATLGGGTHHAYPDHGEGFCIFNDVAVAVRVLQSEGRINRAVILDCDVHQGNGTAAIFAGDPNVFTFSIHGAKNFPFHKEQSSLDIALADGTTDDTYLEMLQTGLEQSLAAGPFDLAVYLAGADPFIGDRLGRMSLSKSGLSRRDQMTLEACRRASLPLAITMSGGYANDIEDIVDIHAETIRLTTLEWQGRHFGQRRGASHEPAKNSDHKERK